MFTSSSLLFVAGIAAYLYLTHGRTSLSDRVIGYGCLLVALTAAPDAAHAALAPVLSGTHPAAWLVAGAALSMPLTLAATVRYDLAGVAETYLAGATTG